MEGVPSGFLIFHEHRCKTVAVKIKGRYRTAAIDELPSNSLPDRGNRAKARRKAVNSRQRRSDSTLGDNRAIRLNRESIRLMAPEICYLAINRSTATLCEPARSACQTRATAQDARQTSEEREGCRFSVVTSGRQEGIAVDADEPSV